MLCIKNGARRGGQNPRIPRRKRSARLRQLRRKPRRRPKATQRRSVDSVDRRDPGDSTIKTADFISGGKNGLVSHDEGECLCILNILMLSLSSDSYSFVIYVETGWIYSTWMCIHRWHRGDGWWRKHRWRWTNWDQKCKRNGRSFGPCRREASL